MGSAPDDDLVREAQAGSIRAFTELVQRHTRLVYRVAMRLSGNVSDAEEILQDTFMQVHRRLGSFRGDAKFTTWLYSVAVNSALMHRRQHHRHSAGRLDDYMPRFDEHGTLARLDVDYSVAARADILLEKRQLAAAALEAVADLPAMYQVPFVLRDLEGLDTEETARVLNIEVDLVRQRLHRARLMLRGRLNKLVGGDS